MTTKKSSKIALIFLALFSISNYCLAWQIWLGQAPHKLSQGIALLEPDNWSRSQLASLKNNKITPIAWLNVSQIEPGRLIVGDIREKSLMIKRRYHPKGGELARFYGNAFKKILKQRIREYIEKGFCGILFARPFLYKSISNNPINKLEMQKLLSELYSDIKSLDPKQIVLVHNSLNLYDNISKKTPIDGIVIEGLFNSHNGKHRHPWQRKEKITNLINWKKCGKLVLCVDDARKSEQKLFVKNECNKYNFDSAFAKIPISLKRRINKWWKETK